MAKNQSGNLPVFIVYRLGKWASNTEWYFAVTLLKEGRLCCSKAEILLKACWSVILTQTYSHWLQQAKDTWWSQAVWLQWPRNPLAVSECTFHMFACFVLQTGSSPSQQDLLYAVRCCIALVWWLTYLLQSFTVYSFPIKNWVLNSKLNCCFDLAVKR